ncbi:MAG: AAA family ATPase [Actinomycetota bacterium]|nr:AAA family ATPase [Actinomycetota bacterium]
MALLVECAVRPPALALVEGEAGVGKTRIVAELLHRAELQDRQKLLGRCHPLREPLPLAPIVEALRSAGVRTDPTLLSPLAGMPTSPVPEVRRRGTTPPSPFGDSLSQRHLLFLGAVELLGHLGPTVLVLEDLHWCDDLTREFVRFLVPQLPPNLSLVVTYRREDLGMSSQLLSLAAGCPSGTTVARIELSALAEEDTATVISAILGPENVSPEFARYIHRRTAGLPFAVEEVVRLLHDRPDITARGPWIDGVPEVRGVPAAVRDVVLERVAQLGPDGRLLTDAAAIVGVPAGEKLLGKVAGFTLAKSVAALLQALRGAVLVEVPDGYGFRHPLASQAVYEAIPSPTRSLMHLRAARALDVSPKPVAQLAHHYHQAGKSPQWLRFSQAAADLAIKQGNDPTAAHFLQLAVDSGGLRGAARARTAVKLARVASRGSVGPEGCIKALRRVIDEETLTPGTRGELRLFLGALTQRMGQTSDGRNELERCVDELRHRPQLAAKVMAWLARPDVVDIHLTEHLGWLDRAMRVLATQDDPQLRIDILHTRAEVLIQAGDPAGDDAAADIPWESTGPGTERMLTWASIGLSGLYFHAGHYQLGRRWLEDGRRRAQELCGGGEPYASTIATNTILYDWAAGQWEGLEERARHHALRCADLPANSVAAQRIRAHLALTRGDLDGAERGFDAFFREARDVGFIPALVFGSAGRARIHLARGDPQAASEEAGAWLSVIEQKGIWVWAAELAPIALEAMIEADRLTEAAGLTARFEAGLTGRNAPLARCALQACQAMVADAEGRSADALGLWVGTRRAYANLPRPYEVAWAEARLGMCQFDRSRPEGSAHLLAALATFGQLGATGDAGRVRQALKERSIAPPRRGGRRPYGNTLSPREQEVVRLAGRHLTNAQIAETLGLSSKTVGHHIEAAMRKLGVTSRRAFATVDLSEQK